MADFLSVFFGAWINNCILGHSVGCNYLFTSSIPAFGTPVYRYRFLSTWHYSDVIMSMMVSQIVSNRWRLDCLINRLFRRRLKKTSKLHITGLCERNSLVTSEFPSQRASNVENDSIWWRHHGKGPWDFVISDGLFWTEYRILYRFFQSPWRSALCSNKQRIRRRQQTPTVNSLI